MPQQKLKAAIYLRVSRDATGEHLAVDRQREDCLKIVAERGWTVTETYVDNSISASKRTTVRPAYQRMVEDHTSGRFAALVCWDLDRLTRQPRQLEDWIDAAQERDLHLVTANGEADLSTDGGRLFARIKASVARAEIERKGARQRRALRQRAENGRPPSGVRLTGYTVEGSVVEDEAILVKEMFSRFAEGESLKGLARWAAEAGHTPRRGATWSPSSVRTMLTNPRYAGHAVYCGERIGREGTWQPLVDQEVFTIVQQRLTDPRRTTNRQGTDRKHLGSGLYRCSCGLTMRGWSGNRYRCASGCYSRSGTAVDPFVEAVVAERLGRPDLAALLADPTDGQRSSELMAEAQRLRTRLATVEGDYDAGHIDGRRYAAATEKIDAELAAVESERAVLVAGTGPASVLTAPDPAAAFLGASLMTRRATVDFLMTVTLNAAARGSRAFDPESVEITWRTT